jgi:hypothetical protein
MLGHPCIRHYSPVLGSEKVLGADYQQVGLAWLVYPNDHNEDSGSKRYRKMVWSDLHGDVQIGAEMTPRR